MRRQKNEEERRKGNGREKIKRAKTKEERRGENEQRRERGD